MDKALYQSLIDNLSAVERKTFEQLLARLEDLDGNIQDLSDDEKAELEQLVKNYNVASPESDMETFNVDEESLSANVSSDEIKVNNLSIPESLAPMESEFAVYLIDTINESLCQGGASTADAIRYAFHNKWMPEKLKNRDICEELYYRFVDDIEEANQAIKQHSKTQASNDALVAVGLAWFTTLYQCYQLVEAVGDI